MNKCLVYLLAILLYGTFQNANAEISLPTYPPQQWRLTVRFTLSRDLVAGFLHKKPSENDYSSSEMLSLWLSDGAISGSTTHPLLTGKRSEEFLGGMDMAAIGYVPQLDLPAIYATTGEALRAFHFVDTFSHTNWNDSGIDIAIDLEINGRSLAITYNKLQAKDGLPPQVGALLGLMRRSLPACYSNFFNYLKVPQLPALTGQESTQYRQCELHHEWMVAGDVSIAYGLLIHDKAYSKAHQKLFPNAHLYSAGGCVVMAGSPKQEKALYCPSCRKAEAEWQAKHTKKPKQGSK